MEEIQNLEDREWFLKLVKNMIQNRCKFLKYLSLNKKCSLTSKKGKYFVNSLSAHTILILFFTNIIIQIDYAFDCENILNLTSDNYNLLKRYPSTSDYIFGRLSEGLNLDCFGIEKKLLGFPKFISEKIMILQVQPVEIF